MPNMKRNPRVFESIPCVLVLVAMASSIVKTADKGIDVNILGSHLDVLMNETLGVGKMQRRIDILEFKREKYNGDSLVKELSGKISEKISQHVEGLRKTKQILRDEILSRKHKQSSKSAWESCCRYPEEKTVFDKSFKTKVDTTGICELVSESTPLEYYQLPSAVLEQMRQNHQDMPSMKWQYVGSGEGVFFSYPAQRNPELCMGTHYDPRHRPWYVEAARPERKNVVILLDSSNSMGRTHNSKRLIDVAIDAVETLLDSFTPSDKVGIVAFNDTAFYPNDCFSKQLGYADAINKRKLKEQFLASLQPAGQSHYVEAFRAAFKLFYGNIPSETLRQARPFLKKKRQCVILFISDGDASEIHHNKVATIYKVIREGNRNILNNVKIFTFGLGREVNLTLLEKIAAQDFDNIIGEDNITTVYGQTVRNTSKGQAYRIDDPSQLRNALSFSHTNLIKNYTQEEEREPSFSVPYVDTGGLGIIFTAGFPVFGHNERGNFMAAVVAIDISIADLLGDVIKLQNDDRSYVFVIDGSGRVLIHPLMPLPDDTNSPSFIHIEALERDASLKDVIKSMIEGKRGQKTILSSRVAPAGDCNQVFIVNQTYHWHPIANTNFSLCFVEEETDYIVSLSPRFAIYGCLDEKELPIVANKCPNTTVANFRYHRLDLTDSPGVCRHFYQMSTVKSSVVKLAPQCFVEAASYEQKSETAERVRNYERLLNGLLTARTSEEAEHVLLSHTKQQEPYDQIREDVISDIVWTACSDALWLGISENHVVRRFIGTRTGMVRFYPGTNLSASYDPIKRDWYELALAYPERRVFSPPYKDAAGAGNIITISHTMHTPRMVPNKENEGVTEEKIIGVMGLDLSLTSFYAKLVELYPRCDKTWRCFIVDIRGYFVLHKDYTESEKPERKHITGDEGPLSKILLQRGLMFRARCLELEATKYKVSYVIVEGASLNELDNSDRCKRYYMEAIPNSNIFFIAREFYSTCYYETCLIHNTPCNEHHECVNHDDWSNTTCECPCRADLVINSCDSFVDAQIDIVACYPFRGAVNAVKNDCLPENLPPCYDPQCDQMTTHFNCSSVVGCTWCKNSMSGSALEKKFCTETELCYDGFEGQRLPGFVAEQEVCERLSEDMNEEVFLITAISGGLVVLIIILVICVCRSKRAKSQDKSQEYQLSKATKSLSDVDHEVATIAAAIGAREQLARRTVNTPYSNASAGRREERRSGSCASSMSSRRQKYATSPQVVLSIVDGDGEEIARSLPRPVQIVRGSQPSKEGNVSSGRDDGRTRPTSTASIVIGSAGENSDLSLSGDNATNALLSLAKSKNNGLMNSSSTDDSGESFVRRRHLSHHNETSPRASAGTTSEESDAQGSKEENRSQPKSIANVLRSVLKKKGASKDTSLSRTSSPTRDSMQVFPQDLEPGTSFYDMFAEPTSNEGDIPIIQSDHSDSESIEAAQGGGSATDYLFVCSESGRISSNSSVASPRHRSELWHPIDGAVSDRIEEDDALSQRHKSGEVFYDEEDDVEDVQSITTLPEVNNPRKNDNINENKDPVSSGSELGTHSRKPKHRKRTRSRDHSKRLKNVNTDNFIVYV